MQLINSHPLIQPMHTAQLTKPVINRPEPRFPQRLCIRRCLLLHHRLRRNTIHLTDRITRTPHQKILRIRQRRIRLRNRRNQCRHRQMPVHLTKHLITVTTTRQPESHSHQALLRNNIHPLTPVNQTRIIYIIFRKICERSYHSWPSCISLIVI